MLSKCFFTTDHKTIRKWVELRGGIPAIKRNDQENHTLEALCIDFNESAQQLEHIDWQQFFDTFEKQKLAFVYREYTPEGQISTYNKIVCREPVQA